MRIAVEGWLSAPHSYTTVNQFQCLAMLERPGLTVFHRERPLARGWRSVAGQLDSARSHRLTQMPPPDGERVDRWLRADAPYRFGPEPRADRLLVFATAEFGKLHHEYWQWMGARSWAEACGDSGAIVVTPSSWSRQGFLASGVPADQVAIVPHGIDPTLYHPLPLGDRVALRRAWGWSDAFVIYNVGGTIPRKGSDLIIRAVAAVMERYPQVRLVMKANDAIYGGDRAGATQWAAQVRSLLPDRLADLLLARSVYLSKFLDYGDMARLYQAADAYLSPYRAEGFNMPVLEAIACGLPVVCTQGGPTDDFIHPDFAHPIASQLQPHHIQYGDGEQETVWMWEPSLEATVAALAGLLDRPDWVAQAQQRGPQWAHSRFTWQRAIDRLLAA
ncbi:MAG: glycosyltransferase [Oscillatoriales cyanobacterium]|nr:MAG: glycosyltransferase [Oscillatoriales cyanobacterium]